MRRSCSRIIWRNQGGVPRAYADFRHLGGGPREALAAFAAEHLMAKAKGGKSTEAWLVQCERHLRRAVMEFGANRELGHGSEGLVKRIYGHLGTVRHRAKVVEYRVAQHRRVLREQLAALRSGAGEH